MVQSPQSPEPGAPEVFPLWTSVASHDSWATPATDTLAGELVPGCEAWTQLWWVRWCAGQPLLPTPQCSWLVGLTATAADMLVRRVGLWCRWLEGPTVADTLLCPGAN